LLLVQDAVEHASTLVADAIEAHADAGRGPRSRRLLLADPGHRPVAAHDGGAVLQHELELQRRADVQLALGAGADEDPAAAHIDRVALDEVLDRNALELDLQRGRRAHRSLVTSRMRLGPRNRWPDGIRGSGGPGDDGPGFCEAAILTERVRN